MTTPLINASLVATATPPSGAARKPDAQAYAAAMREAGAKAPAAMAQPVAQPVGTSFSRESPFGADQSRPMRPGSLLDIRV